MQFRTLFRSTYFKISIFLLFFGFSMLSAMYLATVPTHQFITPKPKQETLGIMKQPPKAPTTILTPSITPTVTPLPSPKSVPLGRTITLGMWTQGMWNDPTLTFHPEVLEQLQTVIGKKVGIAHFYTGWENLANDSLIPQLNSVALHGWVPMISANPYFASLCSSDGRTIYQAIVHGTCDNLLHGIGRTLSQYRRPLLLRFAWEMNIDSMQWSIQKSGGSPSDFIAAWRHFHDIVTKEGGTNVKWVFSPNTETGNSISYAELYPGDDVVDWLGLDGYNWGTTQSWSRWQNFSSIFASSYLSLTKIAPSKPLMIAEVNSTDKGGDKGKWYEDMLEAQLPYKFPHIQAVVFYNEDRTEKEHVNWLITSTPDSLRAFKKAVTSPLYRSSF